MKKALIYSLTLALALSLAACGQPKQDPPSEPDPAPAATSTPDPAATSTPADISTPEPSQVQTPEPLTEKITTAPTESEDPQEVSEVEVQLFTDCNETVYATGTVNIRASYTADSNKLGSLTRGQSITRTGVGVNDADGWSRVQLADGSTAYISNKYLSVTKPSTQQSGGQQSGQTQQTKPSGSTQQQQQAQTSEGQQSDATLDDLAKALQGLQAEGYVGSDLGRNLTDEEKAALAGSLELAP